MTQRINDYEALYAAAHDLEHIGDDVIFQLNMLISEANSLRAQWNDPQYVYFMERMEEVRESIQQYHNKNLVTIEAIRRTASLIRQYLSTR